MNDGRSPAKLLTPQQQQWARNRAKLERLLERAHVENPHDLDDDAIMEAAREALRKKNVHEDRFESSDIVELTVLLSRAQDGNSRYGSPRGRSKRG